MSADRLLAIAAIALAVAGLALALWVVVWMRRVRRAQSALLSGGPVADLVEFAVGMQARQEIVEARAEELAALVTRARSDVAEALQRVGLQRFDAYDGAEGLQSTALALLDGSGARRRRERDPGRRQRSRLRQARARRRRRRRRPGPEELAAVAAARALAARPRAPEPVPSDILVPCPR